MPFSYPVSLEIEGRRCVVIGGGEVAEHKARSLLAAGADVAVVAARFTLGLERLRSAGKISVTAKQYSYGDLEGAFLAIAATDDPATNVDIFKEADERRVLLNSVDDIEHCHFAVPAMVRRGDFIIAVSTGGKAPALAKRLRVKLEREFGREYGDLVDLLGEIREEAIAERRVDFETWAERWQTALRHDLPSLLRRGEADEVKGIVRRCLEGAPMEGRVFIVGAGPGDPELITLRGKEALDACDVVLYDRLVDPSLAEGKESLLVGKEAGRHTLTQEEINALLIHLAREGKWVVRLKGGDPFVFGRGGEEAEALAEAGIEFEVVPGPSSAIAVLTRAGIPVTDRRFASSVAIVTGHCAKDRDIDWRRLANAVDTIVVLMGVATFGEIACELICGGLSPETPAAVVQDGSLPAQRVFLSNLGALPELVVRARVRSPAIFVVGEVVRVREKCGSSPQSSRCAAPI